MMARQNNGAAGRIDHDFKVRDGSLRSSGGPSGASQHDNGGTP